jgi:hypothetical protein
MPRFEFDMALPARQTQAIYEGRVRYLVVESRQGQKLQIAALKFRDFVTTQGIHGSFSVEIDANDKLVELRRI